MDVIDRLRITDKLVETSTEVTAFADRWYGSLSCDERWEARQVANEDGYERIEGVILANVPWEEIREMYAKYLMEQSVEY